MTSFMTGAALVTAAIWFAPYARNYFRTGRLGLWSAPERRVRPNVQKAFDQDRDHEHDTDEPEQLRVHREPSESWGALEEYIEREKKERE